MISASRMSRLFCSPVWTGGFETIQSNAGTACTPEKQLESTITPRLTLRLAAVRARMSASRSVSVAVGAAWSLHRPC